MSYQALYRTYRPRTFADVVGQSHITQTLQNAISTGKFSHAYLFSGPRGTGKTSAAKIFAQTINCENMPAKEPCNECAACKGILDGSIQDVIEIDAASNTSVDDIRDIREKVKYASSVVPYKVYIIDEVHMISVNAFNALLKTLEEPPAHVVFILATTEPHKIPLTIISRCQRFDFKPIHNKVIIERMKTIVTEEEVDISDEALEQVALAAEGGMRDALSLLDQSISYSDDKIEIEDVLTVTGGVSQDILTNIAQAMYEKSSEQTLQLFDELVQSGKDPGRFVFDFIYFLRDVLFYKASASLAAHLERAVVTPSFEKLTEEIEEGFVQEAIVQLTECEQQIKWTTSPKIYVEVTLLTIANRKQAGNQQVTNAPASEDVIQLTSRIDQLEKQLKKLAQEKPATQTTQPERRRAQPRANRSTFTVPYEQIRSVLDQAEKAAIERVTNNWAHFTEQLKGANAQASATIVDSKPVAASNDGLILAFKYEIHCSLFSSHKELAESILANVLANHVKIIPIPEEHWLATREQYIQSKGTADTVEEEAEEEEAQPHIEKAQQLFGEDIVEIKE